MTDRVIRDGKVAVAVSGSGWTTWNEGLSPFEPKVIAMIEANRQAEITKEWCNKELGLKDIYCGGVKRLKVVWVKQGCKFSIDDYDGNESLYIDEELKYQA